MALKVGNDMKLYYNSGTDASPTWVLIDIVGDVTVETNINDAEVDLRISTWLLNLPSKFSGSININLANDFQGTVYDVLHGYQQNRTITQYASADAAIATQDTEYFKAFCHFSAFPWAQPTQEVSMHDAVLSLSYKEESGSLVEPAWAVVP